MRAPSDHGQVRMEHGVVLVTMSDEEIPASSQNLLDRNMLQLDDRQKLAVKYGTMARSHEGKPPSQTETGIIVHQ